MPFITQTHYIQKPIRSFLWIMQTLQCSQKEAQKILDKNRLKQNSLPIHKSQIISGEVELLVFSPKNLKIPIIFQTPSFVIYNKPAKLLTHPKGLHPHSSLCDALKSDFGSHANPAHRLDFETSGLLLCSITKKDESKLKIIFEKSNIKKTYYAQVRGEIQTTRLIDAPILIPPKNQKFSNLSIRSKISSQGKSSQTLITPLFYDKSTNTTTLKINPLTGRTHQIRLHLAYIGHPIIGDPLYGTLNQYSQLYLEEELSPQKRKKLFGSERLELYATQLDFFYLNSRYIISHIPEKFKNF